MAISPEVVLGTFMLIGMINCGFVDHTVGRGELIGIWKPRIQQ
jgi:hypothetical protein